MGVPPGGIQAMPKGLPTISREAAARCPADARGRRDHLIGMIDPPSVLGHPEHLVPEDEAHRHEQEDGRYERDREPPRELRAFGLFASQMEPAGERRRARTGGS